MLQQALLQILRMHESSQSFHHNNPLFLLFPFYSQEGGSTVVSGNWSKVAMLVRGGIGLKSGKPTSGSHSIITKTISLLSKTAAIISPPGGLQMQCLYCSWKPFMK